MMNFVRFKNFGESFTPKISIRSTGQAGFNKGALNRFSLHEYKAMAIFFDKENQLIGFKPLKDEEEASLPIKIRGDNISLSLKSFLEFYGIDYSVTRSYEVEWNDENGMIILDLKKAASEETA